MKIAIIDTETSGLGTKDEVIQFAALICDSQFRLLRLVNFYCDTVQPIAESAARVNGLDFEKLHLLSGGKTFEDQFIPFAQSLDGEDLIWVEWSSNGFDMRMINQTLMKFGLKRYNFGKKVMSIGKDSGVYNFNLLRGICNLFYQGKPRKLGIACNELLPYSSEQIDHVYERQIKSFDVATGAHHADYDAFLCYLLMVKYGYQFL